MSGELIIHHDSEALSSDQVSRIEKGQSEFLYFNKD